MAESKFIRKGAAAGSSTASVDHEVVSRPVGHAERSAAVVEQELVETVTPPAGVSYQTQLIQHAVESTAGYGDISPDDAAGSLLKYLPEDVQRMIKEASDYMHIPLWQMLLGYTMRIADIGELFVPSMLIASWEAGLKANELRPCGSCGNDFKSKFATAKYCCEFCACGKLVERGGHKQDCPAVEQNKELAVAR